MLIVEDLCKQYVHGGEVRTLFRDLSFTVQPGERLAVLGRNGQGKSTLLKILGGVTPATAGRVTWGMSSSWPLGFTGAFQGGMTGYDNIQFIARIYNRPPRWLIDQVDRFAELGSALAMPVRFYSSGMRARLAFGLSVAIEFDCYIIDEVIQVGDAAFQHKCKDELFNQRQERTFIIASHDMSFLREICERAIIVEGGRAKFFENLDVALDIYQTIIEDHERAQAAAYTRVAGVAA
ncbi:MAG TPA: ABC transporter ATP-binding protein [Caulobacteraceae bacterium]|jgi:capsular polysaccharide transport system ATP-binding protein